MGDLGTVPWIDARGAAERLDGPPDPRGSLRPLLVDVREADEFRAVRVAGAVLVPLSSFVERWQELPADRPLIVICASGRRSGAVTTFLLQNGRTDVVNLSGGIIGWQRAGLPVVTGPPAAGEGELA